MRTSGPLSLLAMLTLTIGWTSNCDAGLISVTKNVLGTARPWDDVSGNPTIGAGPHDGTVPTSVTVADGFDFAAGNSLTVTYVSGFVNYRTSTSPPSLTADGVVGDEAESSG